MYASPSPWYLSRPFDLYARQCFEHGLAQAFQQLSQHTNNLKNAIAAAERNRQREIEQQIEDGNSLFEMRVIAVGWSIGFCAFLGELLWGSLWLWRRIEDFRN